MKKQAFQGAVVLLFLVALGRAQMAPGDEHQECMEDRPPYASNIMMLMNSQHYSQLLGDGGVWDQIDFDDNNLDDNSQNPTSFTYNSGGICESSLRSCGYRSGWQDNWLFTQFISKAAPPNTTHTVRVVVDISYTLSSCRRRYNCHPTFRLYKLDANGPLPREVYTNVSKYVSVRNRDGASSLSQNLVETIDVPANVDGFYLAVRDNSSCIIVSQIQVYRNQCYSKQEGLVLFSEIAAPVDGNITVTAQCMPNSSPITDMDIHCVAEGYWEGSGQCRCNPGYHRVAGEEGDYCQECPAGYYRSDRFPDEECIPCPANTKVDSTAASECHCLTGYFRNREGFHYNCPATQTEEDASYGCTTPPSMPLNLVKTGTSKSSLSVSWETPDHNGGRSDLYYQVHYSDPFFPGVMIEANCTQDSDECLVDNACTITGLRPATRYQVRVSAHNGVSDQDETGALGRMTTINLETDIAPPSAVEEVEAFCEVVVWGEPTFTNGEILRYGLTFNYPNGTEVELYVPGEKCFFIISAHYEANLTIKIFAENKAGAGPFTFVDLPDCPWVTPLPPFPIPTAPTDPSTVYETVSVTVTETATITTEIPVPTSVLVTVPTTLTTTATTTETVSTTTTSVVTSTVVSTAFAPTPSPVVVEVPTTVTLTSTATETSHSTSTLTETVTTTATTTAVVTTCSAISMPEPTQLPTSPESPPCDSCCQECEDLPRVTPTPSAAPPCPICVDPIPPACPPCPIISFYASAMCARPNRRPGNVRNVRMLSCGMIVWDAPEDASCCQDKLTYKVRFLYGTDFNRATETERKVMAVDTSWIKFTANDLPESRPLQVLVKARKQDGVHSEEWVNAGTLTDSYVMDCPSFN